MTILLGLYQSLHLNRLEGNILPAEVSEQFNKRKGARLTKYLPWRRFGWNVRVWQIVLAFLCAQEIWNIDMAQICELISQRNLILSLLSWSWVIITTYLRSILIKYFKNPLWYGSEAKDLLPPPDKHVPATACPITYRDHRDGTQRLEFNWRASLRQGSLLILTAPVEWMIINQEAPAFVCGSFADKL